MQKFKTLFLLLVLLTASSFGAWTGGTSKPGNTKLINGKLFYEITTPEELAWFAAQVNSGNGAINAMLANDIVLGEDTTSLATEVWKPIGWTPAKAFAGVFDGRGFGVYGMYIYVDYRDYSNLGLFGVIAKTGVVQNLSIQNADVRVTDRLNSNLSVGLVAGFSEGILRNISAVGAVYGYWTGGIVETASGKIDSVSFFNKSYKYELSYLSYDGGIVGRGIGTLTISNATNKRGESYYDRKYCVGGLVGYVDGGIINVVNSTNVGNVSDHSGYAGGLIGFVIGSMSIVNCANGGDVTSKIKNSFEYGQKFYVGDLLVTLMVMSK